MLFSVINDFIAASRDLYGHRICLRTDPQPSIGHLCAEIAVVVRSKHEALFCKSHRIFPDQCTGGCSGHAIRQRDPDRFIRKFCLITGYGLFCPIVGYDASVASDRYEDLLGNRGQIQVSVGHYYMDIAVDFGSDDKAVIRKTHHIASRLDPGCFRLISILQDDLHGRIFHSFRSVSQFCRISGNTLKHLVIDSLLMISCDEYDELIFGRRDNNFFSLLFRCKDIQCAVFSIHDKLSGHILSFSIQYGRFPGYFDAVCPWFGSGTFCVQSFHGIILAVYDKGQCLKSADGLFLSIVEILCSGCADRDLITDASVRNLQCSFFRTEVIILLVRTSVQAIFKGIVGTSRKDLFSGHVEGCTFAFCKSVSTDLNLVILQCSSVIFLSVTSGHQIYIASPDQKETVLKSYIELTGYIQVVLIPDHRLSSDNHCFRSCISPASLCCQAFHCIRSSIDCEFRIPKTCHGFDTSVIKELPVFRFHSQSILLGTILYGQDTRYCDDLIVAGFGSIHQFIGEIVSGRTCKCLCSDHGAGSVFAFGKSVTAEGHFLSGKRNTVIFFFGGCTRQYYMTSCDLLEAVGNDEGHIAEVGAPVQELILCKTHRSFSSVGFHCFGISAEDEIFFGIQVRISLEGIAGHCMFCTVIDGRCRITSDGDDGADRFHFHKSIRHDKLNFCEVRIGVDKGTTHQTHEGSSGICPGHNSFSVKTEVLFCVQAAVCLYIIPGDAVLFSVIFVGVAVSGDGHCCKGSCNIHISVDHIKDHFSEIRIRVFELIGRKSHHRASYICAGCQRFLCIEYKIIFGVQRRADSYRISGNGVLFAVIYG